METRKLTPAEIDKLFDFCRLNLIKYFEVQTELVDHFAMLIEERWSQFPELSFEKALDEVSKKFGGKNELAHIDKERVKAFRKKYNHLKIKELKGYFRFPKIVMTICLFLFLFEAMRICPNNKLLGFWISTLMYMTGVMLLIYHYSKIYVRGNNVKILFNKISVYSSISGISFSASILLTYIPEGSLLDSGNHLSNHSCLMFASLVSIVFVSLITDLVIHKKLRSHFDLQYPQFVKV
jgi:hypothetical protein